MMPAVFWASFEPCPRLNAAAEPICSRRNSASTPRGVERRKIHDTASMLRAPSASPTSGETTMNTTVFMTPPTTTARGPAETTAAPTNPPISACDDDVGSPHHHVSRFHTSAASSAASTIPGVTTAGSTVPLAIVFATCTPNTANATKLKNAAQTTAHRGDSTRVLTTVAIEFAASWNPFVKSNASASRMMRTVSSGSGPGMSAALHDDGLDGVRHVLALVRGVLESIVDLLPAHDVEEVVLAAEQVGGDLARDA